MSSSEQTIWEVIDNLKQGRLQGLETRFITFRRGRSHVSTILLVILILLLVGALPTWPHSANWGYGPSGGLSLVLLVLLILLLTGRL